MDLFKFAYVRGIQHALINTGALQKYANEDLANAAAVQAAEGNLGDVDALAEVPAEQTADAAAALLENAAQESAASSEQAAETASALDAAAEAVAALGASDEPSMTVTASDYAHATGEGAVGNSVLHAATVTAEGELDAANRPEGYAENAPALTAEGAAEIGVEKEHPGAPTAAKVGEVQLDGRTAAAILRKLAEGSDYEDATGSTGDPSNDVSHAAAVTAEGEMEEDNRPDGYAENAPEDAPEAQTGVEDKVASAFDILFRKTAQEVAEYIPAELDDQQKVAAVRTMIGMTPAERQDYVARIRGAIEEEKTASVKDSSDTAELLRRLGLGS